MWRMTAGLLLQSGNPGSGSGTECTFFSRLADQKDRKVSPAIEQSRSRSRPGSCLWSRGGRCEASQGPGHEYMSEPKR